MRLWLLGFVFLLSACGSCQFPYKPKITQGFIILQSQIDKLSIGMNRAEVQWILGMPIIKDDSDPNRATYYYSVACGGQLVVQEQWVLYFSNDALQKVEHFTLKKPQAEILLPKIHTPSLTQ